MGNGDLSTNLAIGILNPTSSVPAASGHAPPRDSDGKSRRRPPGEPDGEEPDLASELADGLEHQFDSLA